MEVLPSAGGKLPLHTRGAKTEPLSKILEEKKLNDDAGGISIPLARRDNSTGCQCEDEMASVIGGQMVTTAKLYIALLDQIGVAGSDIFTGLLQGVAGVVGLLEGLLAYIVGILGL